MDEFIYNIANIFSKDQTSVLSSIGADYYYIGPYQRGYKWKSDDEYDQIPQLLRDIKEAFENNSSSEYFLQYITLKKTFESDSFNRSAYLEVIDGQQRLTTLSILFYRLAKVKKSFTNLAYDKVKYARYQEYNVFEHINQLIEETPDDMEYQDILDLDKKLPTQDIFYMVRAARRIDRTLHEWAEDENFNLEELCDFILNHVKLIVNLENEFVASEEIFANLNDNHVPLTDAYLIKGLLITYAVERTNHFGRSLGYSEIQEKRRALGRDWDTISSWVLEEKHVHYFFKPLYSTYDKKYGMEYFMTLVYRYVYRDNIPEIIDIKDNYLALFNRFNTKVKNSDDALRVIGAINHIFHKLVSIFDGMSHNSDKDNIVYNLLGFLNFRKGGTPVDLLRIVDMSESEMKEYLAHGALQAIPKLDWDSDPKDEEKPQNNSDREAGSKKYDYLRYKSYNPQLTSLLLSFSVFLPLIESASNKFDFYSYETGKWSFEHISPQSPKDMLKIREEIRPYVLKRLNKDIEDERKKIEDIEDKNDSKIDKAAIAERIQKIKHTIEQLEKGDKVEREEVWFLYDSQIDEDSLGNMALLTSEVNSANSNNPYIEKKVIIAEKRAKGYFIPYHTFSVFNKIMTPNKLVFSDEIYLWNQADSDAHISWMEKANKDIFVWLDEKVKKEK